MGDLMNTPAPQAGRAPRRRAHHKTLTDSTAAAGAVKNRPSALRTRACTRSLKALAAVMGIDAETATRLLELIKTDAASRPSGKVRTKAVLAAAEAEGLRVNGAAVKILAGAFGLQLDLGSEPGSGVGRPKNSRDRRPRKPRGPDPLRPSRGDDVRRLRAEHPDWTLEQIGNAVGGMSKTGVAKHLGADRKPKE
jgi:hypothetical protein